MVNTHQVTGRQFPIDTPLSIIKQCFKNSKITTCPHVCVYIYLSDTYTVRRAQHTRINIIISQWSTMNNIN